MKISVLFSISLTLGIYREDTLIYFHRFKGTFEYVLEFFGFQKIDVDVLLIVILPEFFDYVRLAHLSGPVYQKTFMFFCLFPLQ